jgi:hypothetical protein
VEHNDVECPVDRCDRDLLNARLARRVNEVHGGAAAATLGCNEEIADAIVCLRCGNQSGNSIGFPESE